MKTYQSSFESQNDMDKRKLWIAIGVVGSVIVLTIIITGIVYWIRRRWKKKNEYQTFSDEGSLKSSKSAPSLNVKDPSQLDRLMRSRSAGHSPESSADDFSTKCFPQPNISEMTNSRHDSGSDSSLSLTDQYSPFQRSFHVETFPYIEFSTSKANEELTVAILSLCNIPDNVRAAADSAAGGFFIKAYLLPDEICQQTKVYRPTGDESQDCNECLAFTNVRDNTGLLLSAYFIDQRHIRMSLGHTTVPVESAERSQVYRSRLEQLSQAMHSNIGELEMSLSFFPDKSRLKVDIHSCKDLTLVDVKPSSDIIIRVQLLHGRKVSKENDFIVGKLERNPKIHKSCYFPLTAKRADITHLAILLIEVVSNRDDLTEAGERHIGRVDIGPYLYARGEGLMHWQTILNKPKVPTSMCHFFEIPVFD